MTLHWSNYINYINIFDCIETFSTYLPNEFLRCWILLDIDRNLGLYISFLYMNWNSETTKIGISERVKQVNIWVTTFCLTGLDDACILWLSRVLVQGLLFTTLLFSSFQYLDLVKKRAFSCQTI